MSEPTIALFWYCPYCDDPHDLGTWRMVSPGSPLIREDGLAHCPDCDGLLKPAPEEILR